MYILDVKPKHVESVVSFLDNFKIEFDFELDLYSRDGRFEIESLVDYNTARNFVIRLEKVDREVL